MAVRYCVLALLACLVVGGARAALPTLAKPGGPSIIEGLGDIAKLDQTTDFATVLAVGYVIGGASNFTFYNPDTMQTTVQTGKFKSWQCADANGTFNAIVELTTLTNGTQTAKTVCMFGEVYIIQQQFSWVQSETACPTQLPIDGYYTNTLYSLPQGATFECGDGGGDGEMSSSTDVGGPSPGMSTTSMTTDSFGVPPTSF
ncbi:hypothetical protein ABPG77_009210 [Micractinium sp. CCAP 211/92]